MQKATWYRAGWGLAVCLCLAVYSQTQDLASRMDEYINAHVQMGKFTGAVLVAREGKILLSKGYGLANREHGVSNTPQTKFRIGSI